MMPRTRDRGPESFLVLWSKERYLDLKRVLPQQPAIRLIFGGPHLSLPSLTRFGIQPDDRIFPVFVESRRLHLMCGSTVRAIHPIRPFLAAEFDITVEQRAGSLFNIWPMLKSRHPEFAHLHDDECVDEVAICESTPLRFDHVVPAPVVERMTFRSSKGERSIKQVEGGQLKSTVSIQNGYFRLSPGSASDLERVLADGTASVAS